MGEGYVPILFLFAFAGLLTTSFVILSSLFGRQKKRKTDLTPYECGIDQVETPRRPFSVKFFVIAIAFLLFDVEAALLFPWAALYRTLALEGMGKFMFIEGAIFIGVLVVGLIYVYRSGALEWQK